jgi:hypothetical protein
MPPDCAYVENGGGAVSVERRLLELSQKCGSKDRLYRNTLLFLLPSSRGLTRLRNAMREVTALEAVQRDYGSQLDGEQVAELHQRLGDARKVVVEALSKAYTYMARIEGQSLATAAVADPKVTFGEHLQAVWKQVVEEEEWVLPKVGRVTLQESGLIPAEGGMRVKDAIEAFLRYTDKPMLASRDALLQGLRQACKDEVIGMGLGLGLDKLQRKWCGEDVAVGLDEEGVWIIPPFERQPEVIIGGSTTTGTGAAEERPLVTGTGAHVHTGQTGTSETDVQVAAGKQVRRITIKGNVGLDSWAEIFRCFVNPAGRMNLKRLRLGIDFEMVPQDGQPLDENDPTLKAMQESARQLGLELDLEKD